jgi:cysteine-rich repeat protein
MRIRPGPSGLILAAVVSGAPSACGGTAEEGDCPPGAERRCTCADGRTGIQRCDADGTITPCVCGPGGTGGTGGAVTVCVPGELEICTGNSDCVGVRECEADGYGFGPCECVAAGAGGGPVGGTGGALGGTGGALGGTGGTLGGSGGTIIAGGGGSGAVLGSNGCGNGEIESAPYLETCDDGNTLPGDGCTGACEVEPGWSCPFAGAPCVWNVVCGDGELGLGEVCDDGNASAGDGCSADCSSIEPGFRCLTAGMPCESTADPCTLPNPPSACTPDPTGGPTCGDAIIQDNRGEECDNGLNDSTYGDGCAAGCVLPPACGDNVTQTESLEQCDDAVNDGGYGECAPGCVIGPHCGDGVVQPPEQCDDAVNDGGYGECAPGCDLGDYCGDGMVQGLEDCDDGANESYDGCSAWCTIEVMF